MERNIEMLTYCLDLCSEIDILVKVFKKNEEMIWDLIMKEYQHKVSDTITFNMVEENYESCGFIKELKKFK